MNIRNLLLCIFLSSASSCIRLYFFKSINNRSKKGKPSTFFQSADHSMSYKLHYIRIMNQFLLTIIQIVTTVNLIVKNKFSSKIVTFSINIAFSTRAVFWNLLNGTCGMKQTPKTTQIHWCNVILFPGQGVWRTGANFWRFWPPSHNEGLEWDEIPWESRQRIP
jgi:hypothetical protein